MYLLRHILLATVLYPVFNSNAAPVPTEKLEPVGNDGHLGKSTSDRFGTETKVIHQPIFLRSLLIPTDGIVSVSKRFNRNDFEEAKTPEYWEVII